MTIWVVRSRLDTSLYIPMAEIDRRDGVPGPHTGPSIPYSSQMVLANFVDATSRCRNDL